MKSCRNSILCALASYLYYFEIKYWDEFRKEQQHGSLNALGRFAGLSWWWECTTDNARVEFEMFCQIGSLALDKECGNANLEICSLYNSKTTKGFIEGEEVEVDVEIGLITAHRIVKCGEIVVCSQFIYQASTGNEPRIGIIIIVKWHVTHEMKCY